MPHPEPLAYHLAIVEHLRTEMPSAWAHYASDQHRAEEDDAVRLHLLRTTYSMPRDSHPDAYTLVDEVARSLGLTVPVELYQQEQEDDRLNAALYIHPTVARLVLCGPVFERLEPDECRALVAHELAHHLLWTHDHGAHHTADRVLHGLAEVSGTSTVQALRLHRLHTEVYCDRAALTVVPAEVAIRMLVKVRTGVSKVDAAAFLAQSETLLEADGEGSRGWTHPEAHLRTLCLSRFEHDPKADVWELLQGPLHLDELDLIRRLELHHATRDLIGHLLKPTWMQTDALLAHTRVLFDGEVPPPGAWPPVGWQRWGESVRDYIVAVLVDYAAVDPVLDDLPFLHGHRVAEELGLAERFEKATNKLLKRRRRDLTAALEHRDSQLDAAEEPPDAEDPS